MVAVSGIVNYNEKILIGKKRSDSKKFLAGCWHIPGETVKENESDETALKRGFKEEANLEITVGKYICSSTTPSSKTENRWYECFSETEIVKPSSDLEEIKWVLKKDVFCECDKKAINLWPSEVIKYLKK